MMSIRGIRWQAGLQFHALLMVHDSPRKSHTWRGRTPEGMKTAVVAGKRLIRAAEFLMMAARYLNKRRKATRWYGKLRW